MRFGFFFGEAGSFSVIEKSLSALVLLNVGDSSRLSADDYVVSPGLNFKLDVPPMSGISLPNCRFGRSVWPISPKRSVAVPPMSVFVALAVGCPAPDGWKCALAVACGEATVDTCMLLPPGRCSLPLCMWND